MTYVYPHKILKPGDKVFYIQGVAGRVRYAPRDYIIECTVNEINTAYTHPETGKSIWHNQHLDGRPETATTSTDVLGPEGWPLSKNVDLKLLETIPVYNQFLWIDEPVGHAVSLGDECWLTLAEAMEIARPTRKKHLKRNLKKVRGSIHRFIAGTWRRNGEKHPGFDALPMKKVYVK